MSRTPAPPIDAPPRAAAAQPPPGSPAPARTARPHAAPTHPAPAGLTHAGAAQSAPAGLTHAGAAQSAPAGPTHAGAAQSAPHARPSDAAAAHPAADAPLFVPRLAIEPEPCSTCGALLAPDQRYCLSCGERRGSLRVPFPTAPAPAAASAPAPVARAPRRRPALPQSALSALYGLAGAAALGLGLLAGALIVRANDDPAPQAAVALTAQPTATAATAAPTATPPAAASAPATFTPDWPAGQNGWTVQLQTLPKDGTTPEAVATAKADATAGGAADVGALDSDAFGTLDGGNYVIYSGVATSKQDAETAKEGLIANFPDATVVEVADKASEEAPVTETPEDLKQKEEKQTPEDAQKNTRKAPPTVESEGTPPPADDEEPGAGSDATEIG